MASESSKPHKCEERGADGYCNCGEGYGHAIGALWRIAMWDDAPPDVDELVSAVLIDIFGDFETAEKYWFGRWMNITGWRNWYTHQMETSLINKFKFGGHCLSRNKTVDHAGSMPAPVTIRVRIL